MIAKYCLDTSAILAYTDDEEGSDVVVNLLKKAAIGQVDLFACTISLMELFYISLRSSNESTAAYLIGLVKSWPIHWVEPDEKILLQAGKIKANFRLSVADALIASTAKITRAILLHKDPEYVELKGEIKMKSLPFKKIRGK